MLEDSGPDLGADVADEAGFLLAKEEDRVRDGAEGRCRREWLRGFGFIRRDDGQADIFVHYSNVEGFDSGELKVGQARSADMKPYLLLC